QRLSERSGVRPLAVAELMRPCKPAVEGGRDLEQTLRQLEAGARPEAAEDLARTTAALAERLPAHDPGRDRPAWRRLSGSLRASAFDLSAALAAQDEPAAFAAAHRLTASCQQCHA